MIPYKVINNCRTISIYQNIGRKEIMITQSTYHAIGMISFQPWTPGYIYRDWNDTVAVFIVKLKEVTYD